MFHEDTGDSGQTLLITGLFESSLGAHVRRRECRIVLLFFLHIKQYAYINPVSILLKSITGRYRPVRIADGPITARCRFINNASRENT